MDDLTSFILELKRDGNTLITHFQNGKMLVQSLEELNEIIGMRKIKGQIVKQIKTFISNKVKGIYNERDRKHCLLCGPPGCGKTTVAKVLCKVWIGMGFISGETTNKKVKTFNKLQDEMIRKQKSDIKEYKDRLKMCTKIVNNLGRVGVISKRSLASIVSQKDKLDPRVYSNLFNDLTGAANIIEDSNKLSVEVNRVPQQSYKGMEVEIDKEMEVTRDDVDLPFYVYNKNDVVSRYVGDTSHRCTKAMNEALGGVAYFDEAYNLCNDTHGLGDSYGREALTIINQYMDTFSDRLIVVFSGYKEDIYNGIFKVQRGLESRFTNKFDIEAYTPDEMTQIFIQRLSIAGWELRKTPELVKIIEKDYKCFQYFGRDMDTLALYTKNVMSERVFQNIVDGDKFPSTITDLDVVRRAVSIFKDNMIQVDDTRTDLQKLMEGLRA